MRRRPRLTAALTGVIAVGVLTAAGPGGRRGPVTAEGQSEPQYAQSFVTAYEIPTSHGILRGEVRRPVVPDGVLVPIILQVSPYGVVNEATARYEQVELDATSRFFVPRGYAFATFDAVGTHASGGCTSFGGLAERESTAQLIEALGEMDWSNGRVGMIGASYDGTLAIAAAVEAPEHLVTIVAQVAIDRWYDYMFNQGVRLSLEDVQGRSGTIPADPPLDSPLDYDFAYGVVPDATKDPLAIASATSEHAQPCNRAEHLTRGYEQDPLYDDFWQQRDYRSRAAGVTASVLLEGAWLDDNVKHWSATRFFDALPDELPKRLVIGQWTHATSKFSDAIAIRHAWFDHFLLGLDTRVLRLARVDSEANDGRRRQSDTWPPTGTLETSWSLDADGLRPAGDLGWSDLDPTLGEERLIDGSCVPTTCAVFVGPTSGNPQRIVGAPRFEAVLASDATSTHVAIVLIDVSGSGEREIISRGLANSRNRNGLEVSEDLTVGQPWDITVELWDLDHVLEAGHHLELVLSSVNATFGIPDHTHATTTLDATGSRLVLPILADVEQDVIEEP